VPGPELEVDAVVHRPGLLVETAFGVPAGSKLALFGPSGAGKSTVLHAVAGLVPLARGRVRLGGALLAQAGRPGPPLHRRRVGLLRQGAPLFPHLSVAENLAFAPAGPPAPGLAGRLGIAGLDQARPGQLSGGQRQRVALARLLAGRFDALLLDEPYTGVEDALRQAISELAAQVAAERQVPVVMATHDLAEAQAFADRIGVVEAGRLLQLDRPDRLVARPASRRVAELVGYRSFLADPAGRGVYGIHPGRVRLGARPGEGLVLEGRVVGVRPRLAGWEVEMKLGPDQLVCWLDAPLPAGSPARVTALAPPLLAGEPGSA